MSRSGMPSCLVNVIAPLWIYMLQTFHKSRGIKDEYEEKQTLHTMRINMENYATNLRKKEEDMQNKVDTLVADAKARMAVKDRWGFPCRSTQNIAFITDPTSSTGSAPRENSWSGIG